MSWNTQMALCEKCKRRSGTPFAFHYGKKRRKETLREPDTFVEEGQHTVLLCASCRSLRHDPRLRTLLILGVWLLPAYGYFMKNPPPTWANVIILAFLVGLLIELLRVLLKPAQTRGEDIAIDVSRNRFMKQGTDAFWNTNEHERLEREGRILKQWAD